MLWIRIYRTVIVLLQIVVYGDSRQPFFAAILIVSLAVIGWRESLRLLSSVVMLLILVSGISEREQRSALRISPVLVSRSSP